MSLTGNVVNARLTNYRRMPIEMPIEISIDHWYRIYYCMYLSSLMNGVRLDSIVSLLHAHTTRRHCVHTCHRRNYTRGYNIYTYMSHPVRSRVYFHNQASHNTIIKGWTMGGRGGGEPPRRCIVAHDPLIRWPYWMCNIARGSTRS